MEDEIFGLDNTEYMDHTIDDLDEIQYVRDWNENTLANVIRLDALFYSNNIEIIQRFLYKLNRIYSDIISKHSREKALFDKLILNRFQQELQRMYEMEYLEPNHYLSLITMFYILFKFSLPLKESLELFKVIFKLHNPRTVDYFTTIRTLFSREKKDLCKYITECLKKTLENCRLESGFNALITYSFFIHDKNNLEILEYQLKTMFKREDLIAYLEHYYDLFHRIEYLGALFINYIPAKEDPRIYFHGHVGQEDFFPLQTYIVYMHLRSIKKDSKENTEFLEKLLRHVVENCENLKKEDQMKLVMFINETLDAVISNNAKQYHLIIQLIELSLKLVLINRTLHEVKPHKKIDKFMRSISNAEQRPQYDINSSHLYQNTISLIRIWIHKECNDSLLINYGFENRVPRRIPLLYEVEMDTDERLIPYVGTSDEAALYNSLFNLNLPQNHDLEQQNASSDYITIHTYHSELYKIFKERCRSRLDLNFVELAEFKAKFDFKRFQPKQLGDKLSSIFDNVILENLITKPSSREITSLCNQLMQTNKNDLKVYIDKLLTAKWTKSDDNLLKFILTWPVFLNIYENQIKSNNASNSLRPRLPYNDSDYLLNSKWNTIYLESLNYLVDLFVKIGEGKANIEDIELVNSHLPISRNLFQFLKNNSDFFENKILYDDFDKLIQIRMKEVKEFERYIRNMRLFVQFCNNFDSIITTKYQDLLNFLDVLPNYGQLDQYCKILSITNRIALESYHPCITFFTNIDFSIMSIIEKIVKLDRSKCVLFDSFFNKSLKEVNSNDEIEKLISTLWVKTSEKWSDLAQKIEDQSIRLAELDYLYSIHFQYDFERMLSELEYFLKHFSIKQLLQRKDQIILWYKFKSSYDAANAIKLIKSKLSLKDQFTELTVLLEITSEAYQTWELKKMDETIDRTVSCLEIMNDRKNLDCLKAFSESLILVNWLREKINGLNQLKTLVDSLSISAALDKTNQGNDRIVLARTLREAGTAYAALIYELKPSDNFTQFMSLCAKVCQFLKSDSKIAEKLLIVSDKVDLFEQVLQQTESAEKNSLKVAKDLNKHGVYIIETKTGNEDSVEQLIRLELKETDSVYSYDDLKDLQNILLLIAPRSDANDNDEVELKYFIQMLESITQLGLKYLRLLQYGCVYFDKFKIEIKCDITNLMQERCRVANLNDHFDKSLNYINYLSKYLDNAFQIWSEYVTELRNTHDCLNYFTIKQIKYIIKCLHINTKNQLQCESFESIKSILFNLNPSLTLEELNRAFKQPFVHKQRIYKFEIDFKLENKLFMQNLELEWLKFLNEQNETQSLSLKHLAVLFDLIKKEDRVKRNIPGYLNHRGEPNLIKCSPSRQIPTVLSIYGCSPEQPLPTNDEILYCDSNTTYEELEIFMRRAFKSTGYKIYTILNVHDLKYEATTKLEAFLISNQQIQKSDSFVLVFISCSNSIITSLYSKNLISPIILSDQELTNYLDVKLQTKYRNFTLNAHNINNKSYSVKGLVSKRSGNGKSMYVKELIKLLNSNQFEYRVIRIKSFKLDINTEIDKLFANKSNMPTIYHIDLAHEVFHNVDQYLFSLIICGYLKNSTTGLVWRRDTFSDLYFFEMSPPFYEDHQRLKAYHSMLNYIPSIEFKTPRQYFYDLNNIQHVDQTNDNTIELDDNLFSLVFNDLRYQRCTFYLNLVARLRREERNLNGNLNGVVDYGQNNNLNDLFRDFYEPTQRRYSQIEVLNTLFECTKLEEPNWHEVSNFVNFLDQQLSIYERSTLIQNVPCLKSLVVQLLCVISNDFGLPSLNVNFNNQPRTVLNRSLSQASAFEITNDLNINISLNDLDINDSRRWERMIHPYIIFNADCETLLFMGTCMERESHEFINPQTNEKLQNHNDNDNSIPRISSQAFMELITQKTGIFDNFNKFVREKKIDALSKVMGLSVRDLITQDKENQSYELTLDNCLKMMAIYMRFKANIPAVIMGETGCGKTSLIKYFSFLNLRKKIQKKNLLHVKIHGGTTSLQIESKLHEAEKLSEHNYKLFKENNLIKENTSLPITAILFFDEANTTEAIGLIKEIMCDLTCNGQPIKLNFGLKIVAAVNPYKKHSDEMIKKLEQAGLGFYVSSNETKDRLGQIPMRQLVYRVQPLPTSLLPIVWDFGRLNTDIERIYIRQMLTSSAESHLFGNDLRIESDSSEQEIELLCNLIVESQTFMRSKNDECSFVSIRDVERVIKVTSWFLSKQNLIFKRMNIRKVFNNADDAYQQNLKPLYRAFILALTVCYHSCLYKNETRQEYRQRLESIMKLNTKSDWILIEILKCQNIFMDEIGLEQMKNIARNSALLENVFMMIICIELRIPLFIVGKPGSSKSLAKSIVSRAMIGRNSKSELYQNLKETYFVNFQCSPLTTSEMIVKAFKEAAEFQKNNDLDKSVSVVNLDEIGLAEGSESMPLKTLHSLLEDGACDDNEEAKDHHRVAVVGISNWALDPAKMNRGLFVSRGEVTIDDLISSAEGICNYDKQVYDCIKPHISLIAESYLELCQLACKEIKREFFGLRDYYSLMKMLYWFAQNDRQLKWSRLEQAVKRNFNGVDIDIVEPFRSRLFDRLPDNKINEEVDLIKSALKSENLDSTSRYLLFLTENSSAIDIIQTYLANVVGLAPNNLTVIFGSSFKNDLQYSEVCRNISLIKYCMEVGKTVILLNSYNLYESLYDALNQYYYELHSQKFVDLGLGTHRIKCAVHENFRLIVIAEKSAVYDSKRFPIPLINRLEKHFLNAGNMLNKQQIELRNELNKWSSKIANNTNLNETFIGLHDDTTSAIILSLSQQKLTSDILTQAKYIMLQCATPDSIVRYCGTEYIPQAVRDSLWNDYFQIQSHLSLSDLIKKHLSQPATNLVQVTTHSKLTLSSLDKNRFEVDEICLLKSFDTQLQFEKKIEEFFASNQRVLLIQADLDQVQNADLIACARHTIVEKFKLMLKKDKFLFVLINIPKEHVKSFIGFQLGYWSCYHIDEIESELDDIPEFKYLKNKSLSDLLNETLAKKTNMNLNTLLQRLAHNACSLIVDTNLERTIKRIDLFTNLCNSSSEFVYAIIIRLVGLLKEKEMDYMRNPAKWLFNEAASLKTIKEYATLRRACQFYFESRLSPLLGYLLAYLDQYSNLDIFAKSIGRAQWKSDLWLGLIRNGEICRLTYNDMRTRDGTNNEEMKKFQCQSDWLIKSFQEAYDESKSLKPMLPFFWILVNQLNKLYENFIESNKQSANIDNELNQKCKRIKIDDESKSNDSYDNESIKNYENTISNFFQSTRLYSLLNEIVNKENQNNKEFSQSIIESYVNDFVLFNCSINSNKDLDLVKRFLMKKLTNLNVDLEYKLVIKFTLPMVHYVYNCIKDQIDAYLQYSKFEPEIHSFLILERDIHLQSAIKAIELFKEKKINYFYDEYNQKKSQESLSKLRTLITLVNKTLNKYNSNCTEYSQLKLQYETLSILLLFLDNMMINNLKDPILIKYLNSLKTTLLLDYFDQGVNLKKRDSFKKLQDFIVYSYNKLCDLSIDNDFSENLNIFYFNTIEYLVFSNQAPDDDTIDLILQSITEKQMSISDTKPFIIEETYRALLIQLVFKNYNQKVIKHLKDWFDKHAITGSNNSFVRLGRCSSVNELALLFQNCVHDQIVHDIQANNKSVDDQIIQANSICVELNNGYDYAKIFNRKIIREATYEVNFLIALAKLKFCLITMAKVCNSKEEYEKYKNKDHFKKFNANLKQIIMVTFGQNDLDHQSGKTDTLINYLIKDMIRKYGSSSIKYVLAENELNWMTPSSIIGNQEFVTDKYVLCPYSVYSDEANKNKYLKYKKAIQECFEEKNLEPINKIVSGDKNNREHTAYLGLSLYQNVTLLYKSIENSAKQIVEYFEPLEPKQTFKSLLYNLFTHNLKITQENWKHIDLNLLLIHVKFCVLHSPKENNLLDPLRDLINNPIDFAEKYLPTMAQDSIYDVKSILQDTSMYMCPNGHKYVIGECTRPWVTSKCNECGADIGGQNHRSAQGNVKLDEIVDHTIRGYSLPKASQLEEKPQAERLLNSHEFQIERFFLHACLYLACGDENENESDVKELIKLEKPENLKQFFWEHIEKDLKITRNILNLTTDELILLLHMITYNFMQTDRYVRNNNKCSFNNKTERQNWEENFNQQYMRNHLIDIRENINSANNQIKEHNKSDNDSQQSKIYFMAYELLKEPQFKSTYIYENEKFWKFRAMVTFDSMTKDLEISPNLGEQFKILKKFNELKSNLKLVFHLPNIIRFINFLNKKLFRAIFKHSAQNKTIGQFINEITLSEDWSMEDIKNSINSFQAVWSNGKQALKEYVNTNISNMMILLQTEYEFNMNSKLSNFLPTKTGDGLFSYSLIRFLSSIHNEMISFYQESKRLDQNSFENIPQPIESFENINSIIKFDENNDLFRLVQANFTYDLKNLKCDYKFKNIENQLINRYLRSKSRIDINSIHLFEYSDEINDLNIFKKLDNTHILDLVTQSDINEEFKKINEISEALNILKVIINYASTLTVSPSEPISSFIKKIYSNDTSLIKQAEHILKTKIVEKCQLGHLKHIWLLLMMKKSILYTKNNQDPFDYMNQKFKNDMELDHALNMLDTNSLLLSVLLVLYQIITFDLSSLQEEDIDDRKCMRINAIISSLEDYSDFIIPENISKLPQTFPDPVITEENETDMITQARMENIYALWKLLCKRIN